MGSEYPRVLLGDTCIHTSFSLDTAITWAEGWTSGRPNTEIKVVHEREGFPTYIARVRNGVSMLRKVAA